MTPPNDAARPVYIVNTGETDEVGREIYHVTRNGPFPLADNEKLYTAADYDALRAEVERLRVSYGLEYLLVAEATASAEAAEAKVAALIAAGNRLDSAMDMQQKRESGEFHLTQQAAAAVWAEARLQWAALNEGGE